VLNAIIDELVSGKRANDKHFSPVVWRYSNAFLDALLDGYLDGDGHYDQSNNRWRLCFTRNYNLEVDLRTICARLGYRLVLKLSSTTYGDKKVPIFRGEIRKTQTGHWNENDPCEVVGIEKARCRQVWDLGVADEPHLFALASGVLTHNSKPNAMPESVKDRPTKAHEYIFLLSKSPKYYYDYEAIKEPAAYDGRKDTLLKGSPKYEKGMVSGQVVHSMAAKGHERWKKNERGEYVRNKRSVWTVPTKPFPEAHFAVYPPALITPCVLAGCPVGGTVLDPFAGSGTTLLVAIQHHRKAIGIELNPEYIEIAKRRLNSVQLKFVME